MDQIIKEIEKLIDEPIIKLILNIILTGGLFYWIQRRHKWNDDFIIEKNKKLVDKFIECESEIFMLMNKVKTKNLSSDLSIKLSKKIKNLSIINYLYISKELLIITNDFCDYLLEISVIPKQKDIIKENELINKFKTEFKK